MAQLSLQDAQAYLPYEPTQQLDVYYRRQLLTLVHSWVAQHGKTVLCSTHDLDNLPEPSGYLLTYQNQSPSCGPFRWLRCARPGLDWSRLRFQLKIRNEELKMGNPTWL